jgi:hypothetical protein
LVKACNERLVAALSVGWPQNASARSSSLSASSGAWSVCVQHERTEDAAGDLPAGEECRRVEPALVVPAGHVRRVEELLAGEAVEPGPGIGVDAAAGGAQQSGGVDDRRLRHPLARVQVRVAEDRLDDGPHGVVVADVAPLEGALRRGGSRGRDEVAPELADEEGGMGVVVQAEPAGVLPVEAAALAEDPLDTRVVAVALEAEVGRADSSLPVVLEAGERARLLAHVALGVAAAGAEREQLHQLARVVLVRRALLVVRAVQPQQHGRVARDREEHALERVERVTAEDTVLAEHQRLRADAAVRGREPVVPDQGHTLGQRPVGAHHAVEPPDVVVAPGVAGRERAAVAVVRLRADEPLATGVGQRVDGSVEALLRKPLGFALTRPEAGAPQQPFGLLRPKRPLVDRYASSGAHKNPSGRVGFAAGGL